MDSVEVDQINNIEREIDEIKADIALIEKDLTSSQLQKQQLQEEIEALVLEQQKQMQDKTKESPIPDAADEMDIEIHEIIKHNYFDPSIQKYFQHPTPPQSNQLPSHENALPTIVSSQLKPINYLELKENVLYENIFRMFGVTAFPINQYLFKNNNDPNEQILGLRFDLYSNFTKCFQQPHYCILRKLSFEKNETIFYNWIVYKHTLPSYIPIDEYSKILNESNNDNNSNNLFKFAESIQLTLTKTQYKLDKFNQLLRFNKNQFGLDKDEAIFINLDCDLLGQRILLNLSHNSKTQIKKTQMMGLELICSNDLIEVIHFTNFPNTINSNQLLICQAILQNSKINDLIKNFRKVIQILVKYKVIE